MFRFSSWPCPIWILRRTVFEVIRCGTNYAAKQIHSLLLDLPTIKDDFLRECCTQADFCTLMSISLLEYPMDNNKATNTIPTMVMELMDCNLCQFIKQNTVPLHSVVSILHDVSLGVWYLHARSPPIMHCDLYITK